MRSAPASSSEFLANIKPVWIYAGLAVLTVVVYGQTCRSEFEFLNVDDPQYVTANLDVQKGLTLDSLAWALTAFHAYNWHPLTWMSLQLDYQLFGLSSAGFHFTNVLLHVANTLLLFWLLSRITGAMWCSAVVAALFALHPTHVESVAWVTERKDVLSTLLWLLTMAAYAWYAERPQVARYLLVLLVFALGLTAKPMLVTLPAALLLVDFWPLRRWRLGESDNGAESRYAHASIMRLVLEKLPLFALVAATIPLTIQAQGVVVRTLEQFPVSVRVSNALVAYVKYIGMTIWPTRLAIFYPHPHEAIPLWQPLLAGVLLLAITVGVVWQARRRPYLFVGWFWFFGTLVPVIGLIQVGMHELADRYLYVPSIGLFIALVWGSAEVSAGWNRRSAILAGCAAAAVAACAVATFVQVRHWRTSETLWRHTLEVTTNNATAHEYLATALINPGRGDEIKQERVDEAEKHLRESLRILEISASTHGNLAILLEEQGSLEESAEHYRASLRINPDSAIGYAGLGRVRTRQGRLADARRLLARALELEANLPEAYIGLGKVEEAEGNYSPAVEHYRTALQRRPHSAMLHAMLSGALLRLGKADEALAHFDLAIQAEPRWAAAHDDRGKALEFLGRWEEAIVSYDRAVDLAPENPVFRADLALALTERGRTQAAQVQLAVATRIYPDWPEQARKEAWTLATDPDGKKRHGPFALRTAKLACLGTNYRQAECLEALAAAHAELANYVEAVQWQKQALAALSGENNAEAHKAGEERLRLYESGQPFRQPAAVPAARGQN